MEDIKRDAQLRPMAQELGRIGANDLSVVLRNNRLEITAHVDRDGLTELIDMLGHYQEIMTRVTTWNKNRA